MICIAARVAASGDNGYMNAGRGQVRRWAETAAGGGFLAEARLPAIAERDAA